MTNFPENLVSPFASTPGADIPSGQSFTEAQAAEATEAPAAETPVNPNALIIPDYSQIAPTMGKLVAAQFEHVATLSGAAKLASSAVAPLVAAARGYSTVTPDNLKASAEKLGVKLNTAHGKQLKTVAETGDGLIMPWPSMTAVAEAASRGETLEPGTYQLRPARAVVNSKGKEAKYLSPFGTDTVLGTHPATPNSWIRSAPRVLVAEGLLKADAAFSAHLIAHGVPEAELLNVFDGNQGAAQAVLARLMETIPEADRVLIVSVIGSGNWSQKPDWSALALRGREAWIAMDADVASNRAVWDQARKLKDFLTTKRASNVGIVTLPPVDGDTKAGLDDFFAAGHSWSELESAVGDLPTAPEAKKVTAIEVATVDLISAVTYETKMVDQDLQAVALAEAAVVINSVQTTRSPFDGFGSIQKISGEAAWQVRETTGTVIKRRSFHGQDMNLLIGARATVPVALSQITYGAAGGTVTRHGTSPQVLLAWAESIGRAEVSEAVETSGLWEDSEGRLGFLTSDGHLTADSLNPRLRAELPGRTPNIQIPWVDATASAQELVEAWEAVQASSKVVGPAHSGLWDLATGMTFAVAVGLPPKGSMALFCAPASGKTYLLRLIGGYYGKAWHKSPAIKLEGTPAAVRSTIDDCNNVILGMDDARDKGDEGSLKELKKTVDGGFRVGYENEASFMVKRRDALGNWRIPPSLPHAAKSIIVTGEDLERLDIKPSSVTRMISFQTTEKQPLLRTRGEIGPVIDQLTDSLAMSKLLGAYLVREFKRAEATGAENTRAELLAPFTEGTRAEMVTLEAIEDGPELRAAEMLAPALTALHALNSMVAEAYTALGRDAEAQEVLKGRDTSRTAMVGAWRRHRSRYASEAQDTHSPIINAIEGLIASGKARWGNADNDFRTYPGIPAIGREDVSAKDIPNQIVLLVDPTVAALKTMISGIDAAALRSALKDITVERSWSFAIGGRRPRGLWISREAWDTACGAQNPVEEATAIAISAAPYAGNSSLGSDF